MHDMKNLVKRSALMAAALAASYGAQSGETEQVFTLQTSTPTVTIAPVAAGRQAILLPGISLSIAVTPACDSGWQARSLSLSIADIRRSATVAKQAGQDEISFDFEIPGAQLAPVVIEDFCVIDGAPAGEDAPLRLTGYMSAQAALRCSRDEEEKVTYSSKAFDVLVSCARPNDAATGNDR